MAGGSFPLRFSIDESGEIGADYDTGFPGPPEDHVLVIGMMEQGNQYRVFHLTIEKNGNPTYAVDGILYPNGDFDAESYLVHGPGEDSQPFSGGKI